MQDNPMRWPGWLFCAACLASLSAPAVADEWQLDSDVNLRSEYNDNFRFTVDRREAVTSLSVAPTLTAARNTEVSSLRLRAGLVGHVYTGTSNPNRTDAQLSLSYSLAAPLDTYSGNLQFLRDSTFDTELRQTGRVQVRTERNALSLAPSWSHQFTERWSSQVQVSASDMKYAGSAASAQAQVPVNYRSESGGVTAIYRLTEIDKLDVSLNRSHFANAPGSYKSISDDLRLGLQHEFSEDTNGSLSIARDRSRSVQTQQVLVCPTSVTFLCALGFVPLQLRKFRFEDNSFSSLYSGSFQYRPRETWALNASARRAAQPSGASEPVRSQGYGLGVSKEFSEALKLNADYTSTRSEGVGNKSSLAPSRYQSLGFNLTLGLSRTQGIEAGLRHSMSENVKNGTTARSSVVYLMFRQEWPPVSASH
jgi:hypothetical protein